MKKIKCKFCEQWGERAKEDVFPKWLQKHLDLSGYTMGGYHISPFGAPLGERKQTVKSILLGHICTDCNNGWMSTLENEASKYLKPILMDPPITATWTSEACNTVSSWAFKTAIVLNETSNYKSIVPKSHFNYFYKNRCVPKEVVIDLALHSEAKTIGWCQNQDWAFVNYDKGEKNLVIAAARRSYKISFVLGCIILRVAFWPLSKYELTDSFSDFRRLWPEPKEIDFSIKPVEGGLYKFEFSLVPTLGETH